MTKDNDDEIMEAYLEEFRKFYFKKREIYTAGAIVTYMLDLIDKKMKIERENNGSSRR